MLNNFGDLEANPEETFKFFANIESWCIKKTNLRTNIVRIEHFKWQIECSQGVFEYNQW